MSTAAKSGGEGLVGTAPVIPDKVSETCLDVLENQALGAGFGGLRSVMSSSKSTGLTK